MLVLLLLLAGDPIVPPPALCVSPSQYHATIGGEIEGDYLASSVRQLVEIILDAPPATTENRDVDQLIVYARPGNPMRLVSIFKKGCLVAQSKWVDGLALRSLLRGAQIFGVSI